MKTETRSARIENSALIVQHSVLCFALCALASPPRGSSRRAIVRADKVIR
jgi:hypothetical protein